MGEFSMFPWETQRGIGDGAFSYTQEQANDFFRNFDVIDQTAEGVSAVAGSLVVSGVATPLVVAPGAAVCYGRYFNDASLNVAVTPPGSDTGGRIILQADWALNTIRAVALLNTIGNTAPPALTQTVNTTWEISLCTFVIDAGGNIWTDATKTIAGVTDDRYPARSGYANSMHLIGQIANAALVVQIPPYFNHVRIVGKIVRQGAPFDQVRVQFNGDGGANYDYDYITTPPGGPVAFTGVLGSTGMAFAEAAAFGQGPTIFTIDVPDIKGVTFSTVRSIKADAVIGKPAGISHFTGGGQWHNTADITSIIVSVFGTVSNGSFISAYGLL